MEKGERIGKYFEFGYPHFDRGVAYNWPNEDINFGEEIESRKEELGEFLLEKTRGYMDDFFVRKPKHNVHPYLQTGMRGLCLHIGDGGRWIEVWRMMGAGFIGAHNLDAWLDRTIAFNIGSDTIEFFDKTILTPRVLKQQENYTVHYPLPDGLNIIPDNQHYNQESLCNLLELARLSTAVTITKTPTTQEISVPEGRFIIENGLCKLIGFEGWNLPRATFVASYLMSFCKPN